MSAETTTARNSMSRRALLAKIGLFFNGIIGAALVAPIVRYLLSPVMREKKAGYDVVALSR